MSADNDQIYFAERERQARKQAAETTDPAARRIHLEFAQHYARRARTTFGEEAPAAPTD